MSLRTILIAMPALAFGGTAAGVSLFGAPSGEYGGALLLAFTALVSVGVVTLFIWSWLGQSR
ncbi:MAG TPA: hypothetical protein VFA26_19905 [Gemmataceae bacterium]|nr:hypothetical protein [Gemmataceae bacterium]